MTIQQATQQDTQQDAQQDIQQDIQQAALTAADLEVLQRRNSYMRQATADQAVSLLHTLSDFRLLFPAVSEVTEIVVSNGGMKSAGKETQNTTLLLYIAMLGADMFNALYDSTHFSKADFTDLTPMERNHKCARHALSIYRSMLVVDKYAALIPATAKFTRTGQRATK